MKLNEYQDAAISTAIYPGRGSFQGVTYCALKLAGEAGEVAEKVGKVMRDEDSVVTEAKRQDLKKELGDVLWYIAAEANELGFTLEEIAQANVEKLASRKERGKLGGSGDDR
jgi:NTP pyrophosphatase (non-canonical NTP hydrolase)